MKSFLTSIIICLGGFIAWDHLKDPPETESPAAQLAAKDAEIKQLQWQIQHLNRQTPRARSADRLKELAEIYDGHISRIAQDKILLETNRVKGEQNLKRIQTSPPRFPSGGFLSTSQADQDLAIEKHRDEIAAARAYLVAVDKELKKLEVEKQDLDRNYETARAEAMVSK